MSPFPKTCSCGRSYTLHAWRDLHWVGRMPDGDDGELELRNCSNCDSTMSIPVDDARYRPPCLSNPLYLTWVGMRTRCSDPAHLQWASYGGRGIRVCDRWETDFSAFDADMGSKPTPQHTLDRINNDGNYEPGNCRWATRIEQARNRTDNRRITHSGETLLLVEWAQRTGIEAETIAARIDNRGYTIERALTEPVRKVIEADGERLTIAEWARRLGVTFGAIRYRLQTGWDPVAAVTTPRGGTRP